MEELCGGKGRDVCKGWWKVSYVARGKDGSKEGKRNEMKEIVIKLMIGKVDDKA